MNGDRTWLEHQMLRELEKISSCTDEHAKNLHRNRAEHYRQRLRNLITGDAPQRGA